MTFVYNRALDDYLNYLEVEPLLGPNAEVFRQFYTSFSRVQMK